MTDEKGGINRDRKAAEAVFSEIDLRLNGLLGDFGRVLGDALQRIEDGGEVLRSQTIQTPRGPVRAEAGVRVRIGGLDIGRGTPAGDGDATAPYRPRRTDGGSAEPVPSQATGSGEGATDPTRDIAATVVRDGRHWSLSADLPGVTTEDLSLSVSEGYLHIAAVSGPRAYAGRFPVPEGLSDTGMLTVSMRNGILDLTAIVEPPHGEETAQ